MKVQVQQNVEIISRSSFEHNTKMLLESTRHTLPALLSSVSQYAKNMSTTESTSTSTSASAVAAAEVEPSKNEIDNSKKYTIEFVQPEDKEDVLVFLKTYFFKDEPLNTFLKLGECKQLEDWSTESIGQLCSFKAVNPKGEIIGIFLNAIIKISDPEGDPEETEKCEHEKFKKILRLFDYIETQFDLFEMYPEYETALDGRILSVNENYRGMGIAKELTRRTIEYMQEKKIPLYHILCTSQYSAQVCERLGFTETYTLPYIDYLSNGENPLLPADPHVACRIYVKKI